ncbi:response regulator [Antarcticibacterium arcticum]|uniref:Response regulator n=1 Tax=Antarcticibacterium arcticum TaxID=2585771 RepID=A0A5B8YHJ2_9FLAO|nr:response regulator [Antarcticibacterium arcticum]QED36548.1 response regulator [Antarcticibacterium arcticum]
MKPIDVLLVEDNEGDIVLISEALKEGNFVEKVSVVKDGWEALNYLAKKEKYSAETTPDLILLDINLPKLNGHEVLKQIKADEFLRHIPVIILSTSSSQDDISSCYRNFANCFISKPVNAGDYLRLVSSIKEFWSSTVQLPQTP